jgi:hypothetical protein
VSAVPDGHQDSSRTHSRRAPYDALLERAKKFNLCQLITAEVKVNIWLNIDQCIQWEIGRHEEAAAHNILPGDIKKLLKAV